MNFSEIELPSNRKFGIFFSAVFGVAAAYFTITSSSKTFLVFLVLSILFLVTSLVKADLLLPLNKLWMRLGLLLGAIVSPIVMGVIFFGLFTPMSLVMRLIGRDELRLNVTTRKTHWKQRPRADHQDDSFKYQF